MLYGFVYIALIGCLSFFAYSDNHDRLIGDASALGFGDWKSSGDAFRKGPAHGPQIKALEIENEGDTFVFSSEVEGDGPTGVLLSPEFNIECNYISFRIGGGDYEIHTCMNLLIDGKIMCSATGRRSDKLMAQSWDVSRFKGQKARIQIVDKTSGDWGHINVSRLRQTDHPEVPPIDKGHLYHEALRPQFHFTARQWTMDRLEPQQRQEGWINDLNGLIYYEGEYHLFAQRWAKCWLHAVSRDLIHWTELEPAFWEESLDSGVQSGTCVIDYDNTSGLATDRKHPAMIAFWSRFDNHSQCISYSLDKGRTWTYYKGNPIMDYSERDPKVFWYAPGKHWVMMLYGEGQYHILNSPNLLNWTDTHHPIPSSFECPDFFELPLDSNPSQLKWVLIEGNGNYSIGSFDGRQFTEETARFACDAGPNFYATQTWANTNTGDGRRIQVAWMRAPEFPGMPFNQQISFPCELKLKSTPEGPRIYRTPIKELDRIHHRKHSWTHLDLKEDQSKELLESGDTLRIVAEVEIPSGSTLVFDVRGVPIQLTSNTVQAASDPKRAHNPIHHVEILLDRGSIETFVNDGEISLTQFVIPKVASLRLKTQGGPATVKSLHVFELNSTWIH